MLGGLDYHNLASAVNRALQALAGSFVTLTGAQVLTNKTLTAPVVTNPDNTAQTLTDAATVAWDMSAGGIATLTLGAAGGVNRTMGLPTNIKKGSYVLICVQGDGTTRNISPWNAAFKWASATPPVLSAGAGKKDLLSFVYDGTSFYGSAVLDVR